MGKILDELNKFSIMPQEGSKLWLENAIDGVSFLRKIYKNGQYDVPLYCSNRYAYVYSFLMPSDKLPQFNNNKKKLWEINLDKKNMVYPEILERYR